MITVKWPTPAASIAALLMMTFLIVTVSARAAAGFAGGTFCTTGCVLSPEYLTLDSSSFVSASAGGTVSIQSGTMNDNRLPLSIGPGIPAPGAGGSPGEMTVQGRVRSAPEPSTFGMAAAGLLLCVGGFWRKKSKRS